MVRPEEPAPTSSGWFLIETLGLEKTFKSESNLFLTGDQFGLQHLWSVGLFGAATTGINFSK